MDGGRDDRGSACSRQSAERDFEPFLSFLPPPPTFFFPYLLGWMRWVEGLGRGEREGQESREWRVFGTLYAV